MTTILDEILADEFLDLELDFESWRGPHIDASCARFVKDRFLTARKSVNAAIILLNRVASSNKAREKARWNSNPMLIEWFGQYHKRGVKQLLRRYKKIKATMYSSRLKVKCGKLKKNRANPITNTIVLSKNYPSYPLHEMIVTLIHEVGHVAIGGTDFRYFSLKSRNLAKNRPGRARLNLDNLSYFATEAGGINIP